MDKGTSDIISNLRATVHCLREELMATTKRAEQAEAELAMFRVTMKDCAAERDKLQAALDAAYVAQADALREAHELREQVRRLREEITQMPDRACDAIKDSWNYQKEFNDGATIDDLTDAILDEFYQDTCDQYGALRATAPSDGGSEGEENRSEKGESNE
jgi:chromosome segregation ATPase